MSNLTLELYDSGFLGRPIPTGAQTVQSRVNAVNFTNGMITVDLTSGNNVYSRVIDGLYGQLMGRPVIIRRFEYRHEFLEQAWACFNTDRFMDWVVAQTKSPEYSLLHKNFLEDTLRYIYTGTRRLGMTNWIGMFYHRVNGNQGVVPSINTMISLPNEYNPVRPLTIDGDLVDMVPVIERWLGQPNGMEDFIFFCWLVFGSAGKNFKEDGDV